MKPTAVAKWLRSAGVGTLGAVVVSAILPGCAMFKPTKILETPGVPPAVLAPSPVPAYTMTTPSTTATAPLISEPAPVIGPIGTTTTTIQPPAHQPPVILEVPKSAPPTIIEEPKTPSVTSLPPPPKETSTLTYKLKKNETLWDVSRMYGVSVNELATFNNIPEAKFKKLPVGLSLNLPPGAAFVPESERPKIKRPAPAPAPRPSTTRSAPTSTPSTVTATKPPKAKEPLPADGKYEVKKNDSLWLIANRYGLRIEDIKAANNLTSDRLDIGQILILKAGAAGTESTPPASTETTTVTVPPATDRGVTPPAVEPPKDPANTTAVPAKVDLSKLKMLPHYCEPDDTLKSIALMYDSKVEWILLANPAIKADSDLKRGIKIDVPVQEE